MRVGPMRREPKAGKAAEVFRRHGLSYPGRAQLEEIETHGRVAPTDGHEPCPTGCGSRSRTHNLAGDTFCRRCGTEL